MESSQQESQVSAWSSDQLLSSPPSYDAEYPFRISSFGQDSQSQAGSLSIQASNGSTNVTRYHRNSVISRKQDSSVTSPSEVSLPKAHDALSSPRSGVALIWRWITRTESDTCVTEIASLLLSIALLIYILITLNHYDGQRHSQWPRGITLNALLSVRVTIAMALLMVPVASSLGYLRWIRA